MGRFFLLALVVAALGSAGSAQTQQSIEAEKKEILQRIREHEAWVNSLYARRSELAPLERYYVEGAKRQMDQDNNAACFLREASAYVEEESSREDTEVGKSFHDALFRMRFTSMASPAERTELVKAFGELANRIRLRLTNILFSPACGDRSKNYLSDANQGKLSEFWKASLFPLYKLDLEIFKEKDPVLSQPCHYIRTRIPTYYCDNAGLISLE